jgi:lipid kinase, YegS/Rv2252/BmrU family
MYSFIVNPHSRSGRGLKIWRQLKPIIEEKQIIYTAYFTKQSNHASEIVKTIISDGQEHTFIILGGDGTLDEVLNGICDFDKVSIGYIPTGSSNDFARSLNLPTDPTKALNNILSSTHSKALDIGILKYGNETRNFMVSAGIGFDAAVCHQAAISKWKTFMNHIKMGKLTYLGIALSRILFSKPSAMTLTLNNNKPIHFKRVYFIAFMNHPYEGGGFKFCPGAKYDDGILDVIVAHNISKPRILTILPLAFKGTHIHKKGIEIHTCKHAFVDSTTSSPVHTDGEPIYVGQQISATLSPRQIKLLI